MGRIHNILRLQKSRYGVAEIVRWLWRALKGNRLQAVLNAAVGLAGVGVSLASVWAVQRAVDIAAGARPGSLYCAVGLMALFIACDFGLGVSRVWIRNILGIKAQNRLQQRMVDRLLRSEWSRKERYHSGDVINRLEQDVATVVTFVTETLPGALSVAAMFAGALLLPAEHGRGAGRHHSGNAAALHGREPLLRGADAQVHPPRAPQRQPRAEPAARDGAAPHGDKDA